MKYADAYLDGTQTRYTYTNFIKDVRS